MQAGFSLTLSHKSEIRFSHGVAQMSQNTAKPTNGRVHKAKKGQPGHPHSPARVA